MTVKGWRKYLKFRCTGCGNCCRGTVVCITDEDVRRISATGAVDKISPSRVVKCPHE